MDETPTAHRGAQPRRPRRVVACWVLGVLTCLLWLAWLGQRVDPADAAPRTDLRRRMRARNLRPPRMVLEWERWLPYHVQTRRHRRPVCAQFQCDPTDMHAVIGRALVAWYNTFKEILLVSHVTTLDVQCPHTYEAWTALRAHDVFHDARFSARSADEKNPPVAALICTNAEGATVHLWRPSRRVHQCHARHAPCTCAGRPHVLLALTRKGAVLDFSRFCDATEMQPVALAPHNHESKMKFM